jgi:hypothetical protein
MILKDGVDLIDLLLVSTLEVGTPVRFLLALGGIALGQPDHHFLFALGVVSFGLPHVKIGVET